jgi:APA family basic amino acid/polyamine antiporter
MSRIATSTSDVQATETGLARQMGLLALTATGICSMMGAAINVLPIMIQRSVPGIGPHVFSAYLFGALPAVFAAFAYAILGSAMPRAGGSYIYASRALNPYLGFIASFSQWFGLSIAVGVVSYLVVPFLRDVAAALELLGLATALDTPIIRLAVAMAFLWIFVAVNLRGLKVYERTLIPLMFLMFALGSIVIVAGFGHDQSDFAAALMAREGVAVPDAASAALSPSAFLAASALLFSTFIGFDSIAQAGGEARNPGRSLPLAVGLAILIVGSFYMLFTQAVYHTVPWQFVAERAMATDLTAPGLLGYVLSPGWTVAIVGGAAIALINDLPAMLLAVSRLMFAWAEDGVFPRYAAAVHERWHTPHRAIVLSGCMASAAILGSHLAGDFFLGVDILVTAMLLNFLLMCLSVVSLPLKNPPLADRVAVMRNRTLQLVVGIGGSVLLALFLITHVTKDLTADVDAWYFRSTWLWLVVMAVATAIFVVHWRRLERAGVDLDRRFAELPPE